MIKPDMLTADELEALRRSAKEGMAYARKVFGRVQSPDEIEADKRGGEWWDNRLREMRAEEAKAKRGSA
jgi:hypothetical protein